MRRNSESGLTLVELSIAAAIGGLLLAMSLGAIRAAASVRDRLEQEGGRLDEARLALDLLARDLRGAFLSPEAGSPTRPRIRFIGGAQGGSGSVALYTTALDSDAMTDLLHVGWFVDDQADTPQRGLVRWSDRAPGGEPFAGGAREELIPEATGLRLRYFDGLRWSGTWGMDAMTGRPYRETVNLPRAVEVSLTLEGLTLTRTVIVASARDHE